MHSHGNLREGTATRVNLEEPHDIMKNSKGVVEGLQSETSTRARSNPSYGFGDSAIVCDDASMQQSKASNSDPSITNIDTFTSALESGKYRVWSELTREKHQEVMNTIWSIWNKLVAKTPIETDASKVSPSDPIVQAVDINTKSTSYAEAAGASAKELPKVNSNFCPLVANPVFNGFNISIPCKVVKKADLLDVVTVGIPSLNGEGFTKETIRVEYEWRPPKFDICKIFGHVYDHCPKKVVSSPIVTTSNVVTPTVETNDGFQMVGKKKKRKGKSKFTNCGQFVGPSVKQNVRYEPKATTSAPKKGATNMGNSSKSSSTLKTTGTSSKNDNIITSNSYSALNDEEEDVENVYDESANLFQNTKTGGSLSFTAAAG
ncbi:hypothetical protein Tco_0849967 [Tanacetum coccineum]